MITTAIQRGALVYVYNEKHFNCCVLEGQLLGFTGTTVTIKRDTVIKVYDEKGRMLSMHGA